MCVCCELCEISFYVNFLFVIDFLSRSAYSPFYEKFSERERTRQESERLSMKKSMVRRTHKHHAVVCDMHQKTNVSLFLRCLLRRVCVREQKTRIICLLRHIQERHRERENVL